MGKLKVLFKTKMSTAVAVICTILSIFTQSLFASTSVVDQLFLQRSMTNTSMTNTQTRLIELSELFDDETSLSDDEEEIFHLFEPRENIDNPINVIEEETLQPVQILNPTNNIQNVDNLKVLTTTTSIDEFKENQKYVYELMESYNKPVCIIDTETTGTYKYIDRLIQLAVMKFSFIEDGKKVKIEVTNQYFNPGDVAISYFAFRAHKLDEIFLSQFQNFDHYKNGVIKILDNSIWLAHNVGFDFWKLREELERSLLDNRRMSIITKCSLKKIRRDNKRKPQENNGLDSDEKEFISPAAKQKYINSKTEEFFKEKEEEAYKKRFANKLVRIIKNITLKKRLIIKGKKSFINRVIKEKAIELLDKIDNLEDIKELRTEKYDSQIKNEAEYIKSSFAAYFTNIEELATSSSSDEDSSDFENSSNSSSSSSSDDEETAELSLTNQSGDSNNSLSYLAKKFRLNPDEFFQKYFNKNMDEVARELDIPESRMVSHDAFYDITMLESLIRNKFIITKHPNKPVIDIPSSRQKRDRNKELNQIGDHLYQEQRLRR